jgi:hypothetical protein
MALLYSTRVYLRFMYIIFFLMILSMVATGITYGIALLICDGLFSGWWIRSFSRIISWCALVSILSWIAICGLVLWLIFFHYHRVTRFTGTSDSSFSTLILITAFVFEYLASEDCSVMVLVKRKDQLQTLESLKILELHGPNQLTLIDRTHLMGLSYTCLKYKITRVG